MSILGSIIGGVGSFFAGEAAKDAAEEQADIARETMNKQIAQVAPFRETGVAAQNDLATILGLPQYVAPVKGKGKRNAPAAPVSSLEDRRADLVSRFQASPEYTLNYDNMMKDAEENVLAYGSGSGNLFSGNTLKALQDRAARISNQLFGNYTSNLFKLSTTGANAATNNATNIGTAGGRQIDASGAYGDASAAQILGVKNAALDLEDKYGNMFGGGGSSYQPNFAEIY